MSANCDKCGRATYQTRISFDCIVLCEVCAANAYAELELVDTSGNRIQYCPGPMQFTIAENIALLQRWLHPQAQGHPTPPSQLAAVAAVAERDLATITEASAVPCKRVYYGTECTCKSCDMRKKATRYNSDPFGYTS